MIVTNKYDVELAPDGNWENMSANSVPILAVQGDTDTHALELTLYECGQPWVIPAGAAAVIGYAKDSGAGGSYDTLSDGSAAFRISGNVVTVILSGQLLASPGKVQLTVKLLYREQQLHIFEKTFEVRRDPVDGTMTDEDYINMHQWISGMVPEVFQETGTSQTGVMSQRAVTDALAGALQHSPAFVNSIEECTDTTKLYVLPDGYLYAYMKKAGALFINLADPSDDDWAGESRLNSAAAVTECAGAVVTNWIEATADDVIRVKGLNILDGTAGYIAKDTVSNTVVTLKCSSYPSDVVQDENGVISYQIWYSNGVQSSTAANVTAIRLSGMLTGAAADVVITKNEEIQYGDEYSWQSTGRAYQPADYEDRIISLEDAAERTAEDYQDLTARVENLEDGNAAAQLPDYWQSYLPAKIAAINALQEAGGKDCFSFPVLTDIHISVNPGKRSGLLAKVLMDTCDMRYALCLGDVVTRGADQTAESMEESFKAAEALLSPVRDRLLQTQGNHDGSWGAEDLDGDGDVEGTEYYCHNFTPEKLHSLIYRKVGLVGQVHFDADGCGYYVDDVSSRVRYILLNSHHNTYAENGDGTAKYNNMRLFRFGQSQYDMLAEALMSVPGDDWAVLTASHAPLNDSYASIFGGTAGDHVLMRRLLAAYKDKKAFSGSFAGTYGDDAVHVSVDFSGAKGQYIAHFAGHTHTDSCGVYDGITVITTRCDGKEENDAALNAQRVTGTTTEQSFDIFTVNLKSRTVYATKIGAGIDRVITI